MTASMPGTDPIVHATVLRFAREGFDAPLRGIAADAGVSAALVMKRFGSKEGLREEADALVLEWIRAVKAKNIEAVANGQLLTTLADNDAYAPMLVYVMHSVLDGGKLGREFVEDLIADAERYTADGVERGLIRPSRDEKARVRYLVMSSVGAFLLSLLLRPADDASDLPSVNRRLRDESMLPMLELFTEGLLTTPQVLDDYLSQKGDGSA